MILNDSPTNNAILSNVGTASAFTIKSTAKSFQILSSSLYSNKIKAIIRELCCNAIDSHVAANKINVPFEVHLPTMLEPWFAVQDFGIGLTGDQVENIYTTYFESTKTDSNDFIGALGLGSKSPFSYTENFTITAIKDGIKRIYSAFINEMGVPSIAEMSTELTDEINGVEVKFSVTDRYDYESFRHEAHNVFMWFKNKPIITGVEFEYRLPEYKEENIVPGVHVRVDNRAGSIALMGNIAYPLNKISEPQKHFGELASLLDCGLIIEFGIGELDFAASREELSYVPLTISSIRRKLEELNINLASHLAKKADAITDEWARADYLYTEAGSKLYSSAVKKYVADTKFPLYDPTAYCGKKTFAFNDNNLTARGLDITAFSVSNGRYGYKLGKFSEYISGAYVSMTKIPVDSSVIIVLNDLKTGCAARARYHYTEHHDGQASIYCISHSDPDVAARQVEYDKLLKELHNPPVVIKASTLQKREPKKRAPLSNQGIVTIGLKSERRPGYQDSYTWVTHSAELNDTDIYYYVCLNNHESETIDGKSFDTFALKALMDECGVKDISNIKIFGVRKNRIKDIKDLPNWIWFEEALKVETAKITDSHIASLVATELLDGYYTRVYTNTNVAKAVGPDSAYSKYVKEYTGIKRVTGNVTQLVELCSKYGNTLQVDKVKKKINDAKAELYKTYPLLKHLNNSIPDSEVAGYIKLIDKQ